MIIKTYLFYQQYYSQQRLKILIVSINIKLRKGNLSNNLHEK